MNEPAFVRSPRYTCSQCARTGVRLWIACDTAPTAPELFCALHRPNERALLPAVPLLCSAACLELFVDTKTYHCAAWHALGE